MDRITIRRFRITGVDGPKDKGRLHQFHDYVFEVELDPGAPYQTTTTKVRVTLFDTVFFAVASGDPHSSPYLEEAKARIAHYVISALQNILFSSIPESPIELRLTEEDTKGLRSIDPARVDMRAWQDVSTQASPDARRVFISSGQQSEEELKARSVTTIENLRHSITGQQREILSKIWGHYQEHREWIPTRLLHHDYGGKAIVRSALEQLGGSIVVESERTGKKYYQLTLLGVLLTDEGEYWQVCLVGYLRHIAKVWKEDPSRDRVNSHEVSDVLNLTPDRSMIFGELARFSSHFSRGGSFGSQQWEIEIPDSVEDLPDDLDQYISQIALKDYDPNTPVSAEEKLTHQIAQFQQGVKAMSKKKIFIVHGHAKNVREGVVEFVNRLGLEPIVLEEKADKGRTVIEKFEDHANEVGYAIVLLTPDDLGGAKSEIKSVQDLKPRARQNVIFELGFFYGKLSRRQVCALLKGGVDIPSNLGGVLTVEMDKAGNWQQRLLTEIRAAGLVEPTEDELAVARGEHSAQDSLLIYPYRLPPYNAVEMKYVGDETAVDLEIWLIYEDKNGKEVKKPVEEFFPQDDLHLIGSHFKANFLKEDDIVRFRLVQKKSTQDGRVIIQVSFIGAKTRVKTSFQRRFELVL